MTYSAEQLKAMCPAQISECSQKHVQSVIAELIETAQAQPASVPALDKQAAFEAWLENYPIQIVGDDYELCSDAFDAGVLAASPQAPQPEAQPTFSIPPEIAKIIESLHTQDNRITANPLFAVQQKRVIGGLESGYEDGWAWVDYDGEIHDADRISELNARFQDGESEPDGCRRVGYIEKWEFVTGCLTEEGCKQYLRLDGHNLREPRIYAYGGYRNVELEALRKWLMSLRAAPSAQAEPAKCPHTGQCHPGFCPCSDAKRMAEQKGGE